MKDPAHRAEKLVQEALSPLFPEPLAPNLGRELFGTIRKRLRAAGLEGDDHAQEIFSLLLLDACEYLGRHRADEIRHPRGWLHAVCHHAALRYIQDLRAKSSSSLSSIVEGDLPLLSSSSFVSDENVLGLVRDAIRDLPPRFQVFIMLDLVERLPPEQIQRRMGIHSYGYFRKLKCEAFSALRHALEGRLS